MEHRFVCQHILCVAVVQAALHIRNTGLIMHEVPKTNQATLNDVKEDKTYFKFHTLLTDNLNGKLYNSFAS